MATSSSSSSDSGMNGNGRYGSQIVPWVAVIIAIASGFWAVANPRDDIKQERSERLEGLRQARADIAAEISRVEAEILRVKQFANANYLTKDEHLEFKNRITESTGTLREEVKDRINNVRELNLQLRKDAFDSISVLQKDVGGQVTVGDQIKSLQNRIELLNGRLDQLPMRRVPAQP